MSRLFQRYFSLVLAFHVLLSLACSRWNDPPAVSPPIPATQEVRTSSGSQFLRNIDNTSQLRSLAVSGDDTLIIQGINWNSKSKLIVMDSADGSGKFNQTLPLKSYVAISPAPGLGDRQASVTLNNKNLSRRMLDGRGVWAKLQIGKNESNTLFVAWGGRVTVLDHIFDPDSPAAGLRSIEFQPDQSLLVRGLNFTGMTRLIFMDAFDGSGSNTSYTLKNVVDQNEKPQHGNTQGTVTITDRELWSRLSGKAGVWVKLLYNGDSESNVLFVEEGKDVLISDPFPVADLQESALRYIAYLKDKLFIRGFAMTTGQTVQLMDHEDGSGIVENLALENVVEYVADPELGNRRAEVVPTNPTLISRLKDGRGIWVRLAFSEGTSNSLFLAWEGSASIYDHPLDTSVPNLLRAVQASEGSNRIRVEGVGFTGQTKVVINERKDGTGLQATLHLKGLRALTTNALWGNTTGYVELTDARLLSRVLDSRGVWIHVLHKDKVSNSLFLANAGRATVYDRIPEPGIADLTLGSVKAVPLLPSLFLIGFNFSGTAQAVIMDKPDGSGIKETRPLTGVIAYKAYPQLGNTLGLTTIVNRELQERLGDHRGVWVKIQLAGFQSNTIFIANRGWAKITDPIPNSRWIPIALRHTEVPAGILPVARLRGIDFTGIQRAMIMDKPDGSGINAYATLTNVEPLAQTPPDLFLGNTQASIYVLHDVLWSRMRSAKGVWVKVEQRGQWTNTLFMSQAAPVSAPDLPAQILPHQTGLGYVAFKSPDQLWVRGLDLNTWTRVLVMDKADGSGKTISYPLTDLLAYRENPSQGNTQGEITIKDAELLARVQDTRGVWIQFYNFGTYSNVLHLANKGSVQGPSLDPGGLGYGELSGNKLILRGVNFDTSTKVLIMLDEFGSNYVVLDVAEILSYTENVSYGDDQIIIELTDAEILDQLQTATGAWIKVIVNGVQSNTIHIVNGGSAVGEDQTPPPPPDTTAPVLTLNPISADTFSDSVTVQGTAADAETGIAVLAATNSGLPGSTFSLLREANGQFTGQIPLAIGSNLIEVRAQNGADLQSTASVSIIRRPIPQLTITSPSSGSTVQDPFVTIRGTLRTDLPASAFVVSAAGIATIPAGTATAGVLEFTLNQVPLVQGYNTIEVQASTNTIQVKSTVTITYQKRDEPPPEITITAPQSETLLGVQTFSLTGTVKSYAGMPSLMINGQAAILTGDATTASFSELITFPAGARSLQLELVARDQQPKETRRTVIYFFDGDAPVLIVDQYKASPEINIVDQKDIVLSGSIEEPNLESLKFNGQTIGLQPGETGKFRFQVPLTVLPKQDIPVILEARDVLGHTTTVNLLFRLNIPLAYSILQPSDGQVFETVAESVAVPISIKVDTIPDGYIFAAEARSASTVLKSIRLFNASGVAQGILDIPGNTGDYEIVIHLMDTAGTIAESRSLTVSVRNLQSDELKLVSLEPADGAVSVAPQALIALSFNKPIEPTKLEIKVFETFHGKTWVAADDSGKDFFEKQGYSLAQVDREHEAITGSLQFLNENRTIAFNTTHSWAYGGKVFVEVLYDGQELKRSSFEVTASPTFIEGFVVNQLHQGVEGIMVQFPDLDLSTTTSERGHFSFIVPAEKLLRDGRQTMRINPERIRPQYGTQTVQVSLQVMQRNRLGMRLLSLINPDNPFTPMSGGQSQVLLDKGRLKIDLSQAQLTFPDGLTRGSAQAEPRLVNEVSFPKLPGLVPHWLYEIQPFGIRVQGKVALDMTMPPFAGSYDYLPPEGYYLPILAMNEGSQTIVPVGIGQVRNRHLVSVTPIDMTTLNYIGYSLLAYPSQELIQKHLGGTLSLGELIGALQTMTVR